MQLGIIKVFKIQKALTSPSDKLKECNWVHGILPEGWMDYSQGVAWMLLFSDELK